MSKKRSQRLPEARSNVEEQLSELLRLARQGHVPRPEGRAPRFPEFAEAWFSRYVRGKRPRSKGTLAHRRNYLRLYLIPPLRRWRMDEMGQGAIDAVAEHMEAMAPSTRNDALVILNMILKAARDDGWLQRLPRVELETVVRAKKKIHDVEAYLLIVRCARQLSWRHHLAVLLAGECGMRRSEIAGLEWHRVRLDERLIDVFVQAVKRNELWPPKHNEERTIAMTERLFQALTEAKGHAKTARVVPSIYGRPMSGGAVYHLIKKATEDAERIGGPHLLRHTMASHAVDAGASVTAVRDILGQRSLDVVNRYLHSSPRTIEDAARLLDAKRNKP